jgi:hypothetical protein
VKPRQWLLGPILRCAFNHDAQIERYRRNKHLGGIVKSPGFDAVNPDAEGFTEGCAYFRSSADEIGDNSIAGFDNSMAHAAHPTGVLDTVLVCEAEIT